jgi:signal transduction histidine kinase
VTGGRSCGLPASGRGARLGASMTQREPFVEGRREILRQASVALGGRPVTVWEVSARAELEPQASSDPAPTHHTTKLDVDATLRRWNIAIVQGSRWVGCLGATEGQWVVAPVRIRPPAPPPDGRERRSRERLTLELAGLCLGLLDRREPASGPTTTARPDAFQDTTALPGIIAHELANPLTAARAGLQIAMESLGRWTEVAAGRRLELLDELGQVIEDIDRSVSFLRAIKDRARGALARSERFDAVRVIRSCCTLESRVLKEKKIPLEFDSTLETVYLKGDPNALYDLLVNLIRNAADASSERPAPVQVSLAQEGSALRLTVRDSGSGIRQEDLERIFEPGFTTKQFGEGSGMGLVVVQSVVRNMFVGNIAIDSQLGGGTTVVITLPIPAQRTIDRVGRESA